MGILDNSSLDILSNVIYGFSIRKIIILNPNADAIIAAVLFKKETLKIK